MKHVTEPLPDVQRRRPDISAALAAVVEQTTAKEMRNRHQTAADTVQTLRQVLAIELARRRRDHPAEHAHPEAEHSRGTSPSAVRN